MAEKYPLIEAVEEIKASNERSSTPLQLDEELSSYALLSMAIYSAEIQAS